jgi:large subunit ribosomal protein L24
MLENAEIAGIDSGVFSVVTRAADQCLALDAAAVRNVVASAFDAGRLRIAHADGAIAIGGGQARLATLVARADGADLTLSGNLDLADYGIDLRMLLAGLGATTSAGRPEIAVALKGPLAAPKRTLDVSALTGWLALRAVEQQSKQLELLEGGQRVPAEPGRGGSSLKAIPRPRPLPAPATEAKAKASPAETAAPPLPAPIDIAPAPGQRAR